MRAIAQDMKYRKIAFNRFFQIIVSNNDHLTCLRRNWSLALLSRCSVLSTVRLLSTHANGGSPVVGRAFSYVCEFVCLCACPRCKSTTVRAIKNKVGRDSWYWWWQHAGVCCWHTASKRQSGHIKARQLYKNISMLFLFPVKDGKLSTGVIAIFNASCYG